MAISPLLIRIFRLASLDIVFPDGDDLLTPSFDKRFVVEDVAGEASTMRARPFLCFMPSNGLDQDFIHELAALYGLEDLPSLCTPSGMWLREICAAPEQLGASGR